MVLKKEIAIQIKDLLQKNPQGLSITDIVKAVKINRNTAGRYLENLLVSGQVDLHRLGMAKIYMLSQRVPLSAVLSISSEMVIQLDSSLRIIFANEPFLRLVGTDNKSLVGKNIEYTSVALVFDRSFPGFIENIREGITGKEWSGEISLTTQNIIFFCRIAPTVFDNGRKGVSVILEDITQRKQAADALRESEKRYRTLAEGSHDLIFVIDRYDRVEYVNSYASALVNKPADQIIGQLRSSLFPPDVAGNQKKALERVFETGNPVRNEGALTFAGQIHWFDHYLTPLKDPNNYVRSVLGISRDITERKNANDALRESEDRYRKLVEISPDAVLLHTDGKIIYANPSTFSLLGASHSDEIIGKNVLDFIPNGYKEIVRKNIQKDLEGKTSPRIDLSMIRVDGTLILVEGRGISTIIDGKPAVQVAIRDITERKRAVEALCESEEKFRTLVEQATDGICVVQDRVIKMGNKYITKLWGDSIEQILGRNLRDFIHPDALSEIVDRYNRRMAGENPPSIYQTILKRKDGSRFYAELNAGIITYEGRPADLIIIRDINERKKAEEAFRESEATARALINAPTDSVILMDKQGVILALNETAAVRFGRRADELTGILTDDLLPKEVAQSRRALITRVLETKKMVRFEDERDGIRYDTVAYPILNETGNVKKIAIIARDITEQKNIEKQLRESEQMYKHLLEQSFDAIAIHKEGKIAFLNEKAAKILGAVSAEELIGRSIFDLIHPDSLKDLENRLQSLSSAKGKPVPILTEKFFRLDGTTVTVEVMAIGFDDNDKPAVRVAFREIAPTAER